jgi:hypothetical protein
MCGSSMGMVFCPADYHSNGNTGFALLFKSWVISDSASYALACLGVAALGASRQALVAIRRAVLSANASGSRRALNGGEELLGADGTLQTAKRGRSRLSSQYLIANPFVLLAVDTLLFALGLGVAYLTMLVAMVYDVGLLTSLVAGEALTYAIFRLSLDSNPQSDEIVSENCCE